MNYAVAPAVASRRCEEQPERIALSDPNERVADRYALDTIAPQVQIQVTRSAATIALPAGV